MRCLWVSLIFVACSGSESESAPPQPTTETTETSMQSAMTETVSMEAVEAPTMEATPAEEAAEPSRPAGPAPALDSVRWGPDSRDPGETLQDLDDLARAHFGHPARVAGRLRARHNRDRISLAVVMTIAEQFDNDDWDIDEMIDFGREERRESELELRPGLERRPMRRGLNDVCRCSGEGVVELHLMRVVHGSTPQVATAHLAEVCSGLWFDAQLLDFDGDGRVEVRVDFAYTGWESCGINTKEVTRMAVFDVADLMLQANLVWRDYEVAYEDEERLEARVRFRDLDGDGDKDIELRGVRSFIESHEESRHAVNEQWLYDPVIDGWAGAVRR